MNEPEYGRGSPKVGDAAPDFSLRDQYRQSHCLSEAVDGKRALLVFFPFAFSGICTGELLDIQLNIDKFSNDAIGVYGISCDASPAIKSWAAIEGYRFPLLSDFWPHGEVSRAYGVFDEDSGMAVRGTFLIDSDMRVAWSLIHGPGEQRDVALLYAGVKD